MNRILFILAWIASPAPAVAQVGPLRVEGAGEPATVAPALHHGHAAYPAAALERLGAALEPEPAGARAILFGDTLVFEALSPFFFVRGEAQQLVDPVYREDGVLYLPHQFFAEWLPARFPDRIAFQDGTLRVRLPTTVSPAPRPAAEASAARNGSADRTPRAAAAPDARVVVIDAGHGGRDPGRIGAGGRREKDVVLAVARQLAAELRERGYEVHLTRTRDTLIALEDRPHMANLWKAGRPGALFLSIHANGVDDRSAVGFETFFLSEARTEDERRVAEMENAAVQYEEPGTGKAADDLDRIRNDLRNAFYLRASNDLAEVIQRRIAAFHPGPNRGVKQAPFLVLIGAFMPAVLVEMAFISNPREGALLADDGFQQKMTRALANAVDEFFRTHAHLLTAGGSG